MTGISDARRATFYAAALVGLRVLDARDGRGRRFGAEADALWRGFAGHLQLSDRIDVLLRDAAVRWGAAFSPAAAFEFVGLAADEPFGPDWVSLSSEAARRAWRDAEALAVDGFTAGLEAAVRALGVDGGAKELQDVGPATRIVLAGAGAVASAARVFGSRDDLSWSAQVAVVSTDATARQLAGLVAVLLDAPEATRLLDPPAPAATADDDPLARLRAAGLSGVDLVLVSDDARPPERAFAERLG